MSIVQGTVSTGSLGSRVVGCVTNGNQDIIVSVCKCGEKIVCRFEEGDALVHTMELSLVPGYTNLYSAGTTDVFDEEDVLVVVDFWIYGTTVELEVR